MRSVFVSMSSVEPQTLSGSRTRAGSGMLRAVVLPVLITLLSVAAGLIHLAHNYLPMEGPPAGAGGPPPDMAGPSGGGSGDLMSLLMPHLTELFVLNFVAYVALAGLFVFVARSRPRVRVTVDGLLVLLSVATLAGWNAMGRANPAGTGTLALLVELALMVVAIGDVVLIRRTA
jgi:hypothetical protein